MKWGGKLIGGTLGMLALGPIGAAIGVLVGHQFDSGASASNLLGGAMFGGSDPTQANLLFFPTTFRVMGHIAKADGRVSEQEIASARAIMHALHLRDAQMQAAMGYFGEGKQPGFDLDAALARLRRVIAPYPELAHFFLEIQLQAALAGNGLPPLLRARVGRIARLLGVGPADFARLESVLRFRTGTGNGGAYGPGAYGAGAAGAHAEGYVGDEQRVAQAYSCLLYTSDAADDLLCVDLGGRRIIKK